MARYWGELVGTGETGVAKKWGVVVGTARYWGVAVRALEVQFLGPRGIARYWEGCLCTGGQLLGAGGHSRVAGGMAG